MKATRRYTRTGLNALKARVKIRGLDAIDKRTPGAKALIRWRRELITDLGGEAAVSAQQRALVDVAVRTRLYIECLDAWLLEQEGGLVNRRRRAVLPVLRERMAYADALARYLGQLGLERRVAPSPSLSQLMHAGAAKDRRSCEHQPPDYGPCLECQRNGG